MFDQAPIPTRRNRIRAMGAPPALAYAAMPLDSDSNIHIKTVVSDVWINAADVVWIEEKND